MGERRYKTDINYNYGSAAPDIYQEVYVPRVPSTQVTPKPRQQRKHEKLQQFKTKFVLVMGILAVFLSSAVFVWECAVISSKQYDLKQAKVQVRELKNQVSTKRASIATATNLDNIKLRAINELKMAEPRAHQITYIDIKKTSYTVVDKVLKDEEKGW